MNDEAADSSKTDIRRTGDVLLVTDLTLTELVLVERELYCTGPELVAVCKTDDATLQFLGVSHQQIADRLQLIHQTVTADKTRPVDQWRKLDKCIEVRIKETRYCFQCPFPQLHSVPTHAEAKDTANLPTGPSKAVPTEVVVKGDDKPFPRCNFREYGDILCVRSRTKQLEIAMNLPHLLSVHHCFRIEHVPWHYDPTVLCDLLGLHRPAPTRSPQSVADRGRATTSKNWRRT